MRVLLQLIIAQCFEPLVVVRRTTLNGLGKKGYHKILTQGNHKFEIIYIDNRVITPSLDPHEYY